MKKLSAILLLVIFLVNLVGYRAWFYAAEQHWNKQVEISLNESLYDEAELVTIRVPLSLPYVADTKEFQRTNGEVKVNGHIYRYVKSKVENGEYVLLCLPDHFKQRLETAKHNYIRFANDIGQNSDSKKSGSSSSILKLLSADYDNWQYHFACFDFTTSSEKFATMQDKREIRLPHLSPPQPPETA